MNVPDDVTIRPFDSEADAEKLVEMWRASDDQWPGTFTRGVTLTTDWIRAWHRREEMLDVRVAQVDERIVGYASLNPVRREEGVAYVHVINVRPDYQGRSIGRHLLTTFVEHCAGIGFHRVDLHTWSGNLKAVPLYKKTGFFWMPGTSVWMLNFIPRILRFPLAQPFFERYDWYETLQRELNQKQDEERWAGMRVFTYRWRAGAESLTVRVDREARAITAVETGDLSLAAIAGDVEPPQGVPTSVRWRLTNRRDVPLSASVIASGVQGGHLGWQNTLRIPARGQTERLGYLILAEDSETARAYQCLWNYKEVDLMADKRPFFELRYLIGKVPWNTGVTPPEVTALIEDPTVSPGRALDLGCGTGTNVINLARHGWDAVGVDFSLLAILQARWKAFWGRVDCQFHRSDVTDLPFLTHPFDLILDIGCLHSLSPERRSQYVEEVKRLARPGGRYMLYAFTPRAEQASDRGVTPEEVRARFTPAFILERTEFGGDPTGPSSAWYWLRRST